LVKSGYRDDPQGKSGLAQLMATTLDQGAGSASTEEFARSIESLGASRFVSSDEETIVAGVHGLSLDTDRLLQLFSDLILRPKFEAEAFEREKARMIEARETLKDHASALAGVALHRALGSGTPYARGPIYSARELKKVQRKDVVQYHQAHFVPQNAILVVVGAVDRAVMREKILRAFGAWKGKAPLRKTIQPRHARFEMGNQDLILVDRPGLTQAQVRFAFPVAGVKSKDHHAQTVVNALLGEYFNSRLNARIRDELGLTYAVGSEVSHARDFSAVTISSATRNDAVGALLHEIRATLKGLGERPVEMPELETAREYMIGGFPLSNATVSGVATRWLAGRVLDQGPDFLNSFISSIQKVTLEQIARISRTEFNPKRPVVVVVGDAARIKETLRQAGFKKLKVIRGDEYL
jgi:predicted Zn-dependent peptidase